MNLLLISILSVASLSLLPTKTHGTTEVQEAPQALPLSSQIQPATSGGGGEIWQEDDREVLIRNERGTKSNGNGSGSGKRGKNRRIKNANENSKVHNLQQLKQPQQLQQQQQPDKHQNKPLEHQVQKLHHQHHQGQEKSLPHQQQKQLKQQPSPVHNNNKHFHKKNNGNSKADKSDKSDKNENLCKYVKSQWTECDAQSNTRSRTLTLKKGQDGCVPTRTIQKKCKKACRYEKGAWSECVTGQMSRTDKLKSTSDPTCQETRVVNKNCNQGKSKDKTNKERKNRGDKGARKGRA